MRATKTRKATKSTRSANSTAGQRSTQQTPKKATTASIGARRSFPFGSLYYTDGSEQFLQSSGDIFVSATY